MQLSGGPYTYNRFEEFEKSLEEGKGASSPQEMEKDVRKAAKKNKARGEAMEKCDEKEEGKEEKDTAEGVSEEYIDENRFAAHGGKDTDPGAKYAKPNKTKPSGKTYTMKGKDGKPLFKEGTTAPAANLAQRKLNKDENNSKLKVTKAVMEQEQRMAMYSRALGVMGAHYSGPAVSEGSKPDFLDMDKDGDKEESMKKAIKEKGKDKDKDDKKEECKEDVTLTKEDVIEYLVSEGYASNEVSAEILHTHISDEFLEEIEERMISEMGPAYPSETKAQAKAQGDHRSGKSSAGLKTGKNPGLAASHTSGANKQD